MIAKLQILAHRMLSSSGNEISKLRPICFCGPSGSGKWKVTLNIFFLFFIAYFCFIFWLISLLYYELLIMIHYFKGKSTLLKRIMAEYPNCFAYSTSHTTRKPRPGEQNGKDYHFVTREEMLTAISNGDFLEHAEFSGNFFIFK